MSFKQELAAQVAQRRTFPDSFNRRSNWLGIVGNLRLTVAENYTVGK